ncbi:12781_t:CDS:2 [Rhizophagus irregularis]|nr:12781_t:CDS:2 [Rhizophagus irregularis]
MQRMEAAAKAVETLNIHIVPQWNECEMKLLERVRLLDSVTTISSSRQPDVATGGVDFSGLPQTQLIDVFAQQTQVELEQ